MDNSIIRRDIMQIHVVQSGDTLYTIGRHFGINYQTLAIINGIPVT
jgi:LysM repeat protein